MLKNSGSGEYFSAVLPSGSNSAGRSAGSQAFPKLRVHSTLAALEGREAEKGKKMIGIEGYV